MTLRSLLLPLLLSCPTASALPASSTPTPPAPAFAGPPGPLQLDFQRLAHELLEELGAADASAATFEFEELLHGAFVKAELGAYELFISPHDAETSRGREEYQVVALSLLRAQRRWLDWMQPVIGDAEDVRSDLDTLTKWVDGWGAATMKRAAKGAEDRDGANNVFESSKASEDVRAAGQRLRDYMAKGKPVGLDREMARPEVLILVPDRRRFVRFVAFAGWLRPELQELFWRDDITTWTNFYVDHYKVVATQFANLNNDGGMGDGIPMETDTKTGLEQQITQLATNSLIDNYFGSKVPPAFAGGLSVNLVVDIYGECNTRVDGDLSARRTEAREQFVPGGNSSGGLLPKTEADSRWRVKKQGGDRFTDMLQESQRSGGKKLKGDKRLKLAQFELENDTRNRDHVVRGPFLGQAAANIEQPPEEFDGDWQEFLRAYRTCFVYWLQNETSEESAESRKNFAQLLTDLATSTETNAIEATVSKNFGGAVLSSADMSEDALETRFLNWLPKAKVKAPKPRY